MCVRGHLLRALGGGQSNSPLLSLQKPVLAPPFLDSHQRVCTYNRSRVATVQLPGCLPGVDASYSYPVALRCSCSVCVTSTTECVTSV